MRALPALRSFAVVLLGLAAMPAPAQQPPALPTDIETIVSGGSWRSGPSEGSYRIVVRNDLSERAVSQVQVDWISSLPGRFASRMVLVSQIADTGAWRFQGARIVRKGDRWFAVLDGVETQIKPARRGTLELALGEPGQLTALLRK